MAGVKLSDTEFLTFLRAASGLYSRAARLIEEAKGIKYSRQAVHKRAKRFPNELDDIRNENIDLAEGVILQQLKSDEDKTAFQAAQFYLKNIGKSRGYSEKQEIEVINPPTININFK